MNNAPLNAIAVDGALAFAPATLAASAASASASAAFRVIVAPVANPDLKQAVVAAIEASPEIHGIVGTRIYPDGPPATARLPSLCYTYVWSRHVRCLTGAAGMAEYRLRFECRSLVQADNEAMALYVRLLFQGKIGDVSGLRIQFCNSEKEMDKYIPPLPGSDNGTHYKRFEMRFKVREPVPFTFS